MRRRSVRFIGLFIAVAIMALLAGACNMRQPEVVVVPTQFVLPAPTSTLTPSRTPFPTWTFTFTPSYTPTNTPSYTLTPSNTWTHTFTPTFTETPSPTLTPSLTPIPSDTLRPTLTPSNTRTPSITPTFTRTNTPSPTVPPPPTSTPTVFGGPSPTPSLVPGPTIFNFNANQQTVLNGTPVLFSWASDAEVAFLEQINSSGSVVFQNIAVPPTGQYSAVAQTAPDGGRQAIFRLTVSKNGVVQTSPPVIVGIACPAGWFFGDQFAPPGSGCPAAVGAIGQGNFQRFERGFMVYVNANGLNRICVGQDAGSRYICLASGWDGTTINNSGAPPNLSIPGQMFNWAYYNTLGIGGTWNSVIGWGTMPPAPGDRTIQYENSQGGNNPFYIDTADGTVICSSGGDSGTWTRVR